MVAWEAVGLSGVGGGQTSFLNAAAAEAQVLGRAEEEAVTHRGYELDENEAMLFVVGLAWQRLERQG